VADRIKVPSCPQQIGMMPRDMDALAANR